MLDPWAMAQSRLKKRVAWRLVERGHLQEAACVHALTAAEAEAVRALGIETPIAIVPNGVALPDPGEAPRRGEGPRRLLFLGRLHPKKGLDPLLRAWRLLRVEAPAVARRWHLDIVGWGEVGYQRRLRALAVQLGVDDGVTFVGPRFGADRDDSFRHADAFVLPSFSEGLPMAVLEAWSYGLPAFVTDACNLTEGYTAGAAIRIEPDAEALAATLARELDDDERLGRVGAAGRRLVAERFTWAQVAESWREIYGWCLGWNEAPRHLLEQSDRAQA